MVESVKNIEFNDSVIRRLANRIECLKERERYGWFAVSRNQK